MNLPVKSPIVFFDIAGPDDEALQQFYTEVFGWEISEHGHMHVDVTTPLGGAFRKDPAEKRIYIGVEDVSGTLELIEVHGGSVDAPRFEVPGVVILGLFKDPAGNEMGLVEMENGSPKMPRRNNRSKD